MPTIPARVIPEPEKDSRTILKGDMLQGPFIKGNGPTTYTCGICRNILVEKVYHGQIRNIVFKCPKCQSYNEIP